MDVSCLEYCMTDVQREQFNGQGFLVVEDAIPGDLLERLIDAADRVDAREREARGLGPDAMMAKFRTIAEDDTFLELLDLPKVFPLIWDILGWNVQHYISHLIVYPPEPASKEDKKVGGWHQDGGRPVPEMERPHPRLSLKVSYWLSDTTIPNSGAMRVVPGSHKRDKMPERQPDEDYDGATAIEVKPGTAVLFDRRTWHSRGLNTSDTTRKVFFLGYSYRWLRGLDYNNMSEDLLSKCDPIRRQLLGDGVDVKGWWQPTDADVPLKTWLAEHKGEDYVRKISDKQWERETW